MSENGSVRDGARGGGAVSLRIPADLDALSGVKDEIDAFLAERGASPKALYAARLVVEELVTNVVKYAYSDPEGHDIGVEVEIAGDACVVRVRDDGRVFDPTSAAPAAAPESLEKASVGGLGLVMVRAQTRDLRWQRLDGQNVVEAEIAL